MRLLESSGGRARHGGGATMSVVVHAALIAATVIGTARANTPRYHDVPREVVVYRAPPTDPAPRRAPSAPARTAGAPAPSGPVMQVPRGVPDDIPPVHLDVPPACMCLPEPALGGPATRGEPSGGFGGTPAYGAPDSGGTWDAHTVEVPVVPDARNPRPAYPEILRRGGIGGHVLVEFVVDTTGRVRDGSLRVIESTHEPFAASVRRTMSSLRFTPARVQGRKVAQRVRVPFEFEMSR